MLRCWALALTLVALTVGVEVVDEISAEQGHPWPRAPPHPALRNPMHPDGRQILRARINRVVDGRAESGVGHEPEQHARIPYTRPIPVST